MVFVEVIVVLITSLYCDRGVVGKAWAEGMLAVLWVERLQVERWVLFQINSLFNTHNLNR